MLGAVFVYLDFKFYNMVFKRIQSGVEVISASEELMQKPNLYDLLSHLMNLEFSLFQKSIVL